MRLEKLMNRIGSGDPTLIRVKIASRQVFTQFDPACRALIGSVSHLPHNRNDRDDGYVSFRLVIGDGYIPDFSAFSSNKLITHLSLNSCPMEDISFVRTMECLESLVVYDASISDLSPLSMSKTIRTLNVSCNSLTDITPLQDLKLESLNLSANTRISNPSYIGDIATLTHLDLRGVPINDGMFIERLESLTNLNMSETGIKSIEFTRRLLHLNKFRCDENRIRDVSPLKDHPTLKILDISGNGATHVCRIPMLKRVYMSDNSISDLSPLGECRLLETVFCMYNSAEDISFVRNLPYLKELVLAYNSVTDLSPLKNNTTLTHISFTNNGVDDASALSGNTTISTLRLTDNRLKNIDFIRGCTSVIELNVGGNPLSLEDLAYVNSLTYYNRVNLFNRKLTLRSLAIDNMKKN